MTAQIEGIAQYNAETDARASEFISERYRAPFALRCGALLIDYILLVIVLAVSTIFARVFGGGARAAGISVEVFGYFLVLALIIINYGVISAWRGQTIGKWATGLRVEQRSSGRPAGILRSLVRYFIGYPLSLVLLGSGFLLALVNARGLALHDLLAGTAVVRGEKYRARSVRPWGERS